MWKSKYTCFVIGSRYVCTKDKDMAKVYSLVKKASVHCDISNSFGTLIREIIDSLECFARHRDLLDDARYIKVRKTLALAFDTYTLSYTECDAVRDILLDCIYDFQYLEERAGNALPAAGDDGKAQGYDPKAKCREIRIRATHVTQDMSVRNTYYNDYHVDIACPSCKETERIRLDPLDGGCIELLSVNEDSIVLKWNDKEFKVKSGTLTSTEEYIIDNPCLSSDSLTLSFSYREIPDYSGLWNMIAGLGCDELDKKEERHVLAGRKKEILYFIDKAIEKGNTGLYVAKALLSIYNNWGTCEIGDLQVFRKELLQGIDNGCLAPDNHFGWEWMEVAGRYNDPSCFMEDMDLYYEVLATAAEHGVVEAIDIMDSIWEPEQIIEED